LAAGAHCCFARSAARQHPRAERSCCSAAAPVVYVDARERPARDDTRGAWTRRSLFVGHGTWCEPSSVVVGSEFVLDLALRAGCELSLRLLNLLLGSLPVCACGGRLGRRAERVAAVGDCVIEAVALDAVGCLLPCA
jgi:hypothetical protein